MKDVAMCIVRIREVMVDLNGDPTVSIVLPSDYQSNYVSNPKERKDIEKEADLKWIKSQIEQILSHGKGHLATEDHPMRSYGAGVLARVMADSAVSETLCVLQLRGSNRGSVWPISIPIPDVLCWKEFAGVTGSPEELLDPRITAVQELYEEIGFVSNTSVLLPSDLHLYLGTFEQVMVAIKRINTHYKLSLSPSFGFYRPITIDKLEGDKGTTVLITDGRKKNKFNAVVNYDPNTNALEISFVANIYLQQPLTGILSLSGPENTDIDIRPYMEDVIVIEETLLKQATTGQRIHVRHLLSVHGPMNLIHTGKQLLFYIPSPTLVPLASFIGGVYSFRQRLEDVLKALRVTP